MTVVGRVGSDATPASTRAWWLGEPASRDPSAVGAKAANLAVLHAAGLPVVEGFVVPVDHVDAQPEHPGDAARAAWATLTEGGFRPVVVRSSSPTEDGAVSSMAGRFTSVIDVLGWDAFVDAYRQVVASAAGGAMAVLVQHMVEPERGGVLFGIDPVSGDHGRRTIVAVDGGPHELVSGAVRGREVVVDPRGRVRSVAGDRSPVLGRRDRRRLLALEARAHRAFGGPQDVEWAIEAGRPVLLQSRPVTAVAASASGPVLGPGPVAETLPGALDPLEADLWVPPLREAMVEALALLGDTPRRRLARSPVVTVVDRQVAVDLDLIGTGTDAPTSALGLLDPRPRLRRLRSAWRLGRLRAALPTICGDLLGRVDRELGRVPELPQLSDPELLTVLDASAGFLRSVHAHEMLTGVLLHEDAGSAAGTALAVLAAARARGWSDEDTIAREPVVLALVPPRIGAPRALPDLAADHVPVGRPAPLSVREELRLRVRWLHELDRRAALELGHRLAARGALLRPHDVALLPHATLRRAVINGRAAPEPTALSPLTPVAPLPARFRLADDGSVVAVDSSRLDGGTPAGGGRGVGTVAHADPRPGEVLVTRTLDPSLAGVLPGLRGLVAETGSSLSHLAILAREQGVPTVVGLAGALERFPAGRVVSVDGRTGAVAAIDEVGGVDEVIAP